MAFLETPRFPEDISIWMQGGPMFKTDIVESNAGFEFRNKVWSRAKCQYDISTVLRTVERPSALYAQSIIRNFFRAVGGSFGGFRVKDFSDYKDEGGGLLGTDGLGHGIPAYQMFKNYTVGALTDQRIIQKPVSGQVQLQRGGSPVTLGSGAGNAAIDYTTGIVTFVADASSGATSITVGSTTTVVLTTNPGTLVAGQLLYLSGFAGADAALVNSIAHTINSVAGSGPFTFVLATNTAGKTITLGSGTGKKYPQLTEGLTWTGQFDVPVRFGTDLAKIGLGSEGALYEWQSIIIMEFRIPT